MADHIGGLAAHPATLDAAKFASPPQAPGDRQLGTREAFDKFVGVTFYSQMLKALRSTTDEPAYFHGGRAEEVFQGQLDQMLAEKMSEADAGGMAETMYELFSQQTRY